MHRKHQQKIDQQTACRYNEMCTESNEIWDNTNTTVTTSLVQLQHYVLQFEMDDSKMACE